MAATVGQADTPDIADISDFPLDVFHSLLRYLTPLDTAQLMASSSKLYAIAGDDAVWRLICENLYGNQTAVRSWVPGERCGPKLYRELYPVLTTHASYVGVWHKAAAGSPAGALYSFRWAPSGIDVVQLLPSRRYLTSITHERLCTLGPSHPRYQAEVVDGTKCVLRDYGSSAHSPAKCSAAEAAACVAAGGASSSRSPPHEVPMGGSPGAAGFAYELMRFMQSSVQKKGSSRNRRSRGGSDSSPPILHHFCRVQGLLRQPGRQHPHQLSGLWKGLYGPHGCELLAVSYDFSERSARIVATKLTGDANVPAGEVTWRVAAAPVPSPWPEEEVRLVELRPHLVSASAATAARLAEFEAADGAAGNVIAALVQQEAPPQHAVQLLQQQEQQQAAAGVAELQLQQQAEADKVSAWAAAMQARRVLGIYKGKGRVAGHGFKDPSWVDGRLWVYEDGSCGFVFVLGPLACHLIDLERLDGDL